MNPLRIFIDAEFTNFLEPKLISLGLALENKKSLYVEVPFPTDECSDFVQEIVCPMLGRYPEDFCEISGLRSRLVTWLENTRLEGQVVEICFDSQRDWDLFIDALEYSIPPWIKPRNVIDQTDESLLSKFWEQANESSNGEREHHALSDAKALAYAFRDS